MGFRRFDKGRRREPQKRVNHRIRVPEIRVIDANGEMLGVMSTQDALKRAREQGLDLVEINPKASPPVCKILDFGKFKYEEKKKAREAKRKQSTVEIKEVKLRPKTDEHDLDFKSRAARKFLEQGNKVKFTVRFRGREITHPEKAREQLEWILSQCEEISNVEVRPSMEGRTMTMMVAPKPYILQQVAAERAAAEKERKEAEAARRAEKAKRGLGSEAGQSQPGDSDEGYEDDDEYDDDEDDDDEDDDDDDDDDDDEKDDTAEPTAEEAPEKRPSARGQKGEKEKGAAVD